MRAVADSAKALSSIQADDERAIRFEDPVFIFRIDDEIREIEWTPDHRLTAIAHLPGASAVARAVERVLRWNCFDESVDNIWVRRCDSYCDATPRLSRQTFSGRFGE